MPAFPTIRAVEEFRRLNDAARRYAASRVALRAAEAKFIGNAS